MKLLESLFILTTLCSWLCHKLHNSMVTTGWLESCRKRTSQHFTNLYSSFPFIIYNFCGLLRFLGLMPSLTAFFFPHVWNPLSPLCVFFRFLFFIFLFSYALCYKDIRLCWWCWSRNVTSRSSVYDFGFFMYARLV